MTSVPVFDIQDAESQLARLIGRVQAGESIVIAKAGKPVARLDRIVATAAVGVRRLGFLQGQGTIPDDFDSLGQTQGRDIVHAKVDQAPSG